MKQFNVGIVGYGWAAAWLVIQSLVLAAEGTGRWEPENPRVLIPGERIRVAVAHRGVLHVVTAAQSSAARAKGQVARLVGGRWEFLPGTFSGAVNCLHSWRGKLLVGGGNLLVESGEGTPLMVREGETWKLFPLRESAAFLGQVEAMAGNDAGKLAVAGISLDGGERRTVTVALWDGRTWKTAGGGMAFPGEVSLEGLAVGAEDRVYLLVEEYKPVRRSVLRCWSEPDGWRQLPGAIQMNRLALAPDGSLYVGGVFRASPNFEGGVLARWDGRHWRGVGGGLSHPGSPGLDPKWLIVDVTAMSPWRGDLVVGGSFRRAGEVEANLIARWNGAEWRALAEGLGRQSFSHADGAEPAYWESNYPTGLFPAGDALYAVGRFDRAGGRAVRGVARWDGQRWENPVTLSPFRVNGPIKSLATVGTNLVAAGMFTVAGNVAVTGLARWDGERWNSLSPPPRSAPGAFSRNPLIADGGHLWFKCSPSYHGKPSFAVDLMCWDGKTWRRLSRSTADFFSAMTARKGALFFHGDAVWRWDGTNQTRIAPAVGSSEHVGGLIWLPDGRLAALLNREPGVMVLEGGKWSPLGNGLAGMGIYTVPAAATDEKFLYLGGGFSHFGAKPASGRVWRRMEDLEEAPKVVRWSPEQGYEPLGPVDRQRGRRESGEIKVLVCWRGQVFAGGWFQHIGGVPARNIARWDGHRWHAMGDGVGGRVQALAVMGDYLYVGGRFDSVSGQPAENFARWKLDD